MRLATIDVGTNTVRTLVADVTPARHWIAVHQAQRVTRLGEGATASGVLASAAMATTVATVAEYAAHARALGAARLRIVATSAVRDARNGDAFVRLVEDMTGIRLQVASGADEARMTVRGVVDGLDNPGGTLVVFDIGGGSTEYALVREGALVESVSLRLGVVALAERFPFPGPAAAGRYDVMMREVADRLAREVPSSLRDVRLHALVGTAGTVTTVAALDLGLTAYDPARVQGHRLTAAAITRQRARLAGLTLAERAALPCLEPGRADLILPGLAIVEATLALFGSGALVVSDAGLREGMLAELADTLGGGGAGGVAN